MAAWAGEPQYTSLTVSDPDNLFQGLDKEFGVLTFDGTQQHFVLDGQHRLRAIKDAIKQKQELGKEDIGVLTGTRYDTPEGRVRTRRLFANINRNAVKTAAAEGIVSDEDDGFAVPTRMLLEEHPFLKEDGRVLDWRSAAPPFTAVFAREGGKKGKGAMVVGKENADSLCALLHAHLAPRSMKATKQARKTYTDLRGQPYPVDGEELAKRLPTVELPGLPEPVSGVEERSELVDAEAANLAAPLADAADAT